MFGLFFCRAELSSCEYIIVLCSQSLCILLDGKTSLSLNCNSDFLKCYSGIVDILREQKAKNHIHVSW